MSGIDKVKVRMVWYLQEEFSYLWIELEATLTAHGGCPDSCLRAPVLLSVCQVPRIFGPSIKMHCALSQIRPRGYIAKPRQFSSSLLVFCPSCRRYSCVGNYPHCRITRTEIGISLSMFESSIEFHLVCLVVEPLAPCSIF